jgi:hypothetical protein
MIVPAMVAAFAHVAEARGVVDRTKPSVRGILRSSLDVPASQDAVDGIAIRHIRVEAATSVDGSPSVFLKFDVHNEGSANVTDIVLSVSLRKSDTAEPVEPTVRVQPFTIKIPNVLLAGYSFDYEIRLRNVSLETANAPAIEVVDARRAVDDVF